MTGIRRMKFSYPFFSLTLLGAILLTGCQSKGAKEDTYENLTAEQIYSMGKNRLEKKKYHLAIEDFEAVDARYPFGEYAEKAQLASLYSFFQKEDYDSCGAAAARFIRVFPRHPHVDYAYYMRGLASFYENLGFVNRYFPMERQERDMSFVHEALGHFAMLVVKYPTSEYVPDAKRRMVYLRNTLALHDLGAARFYVKRKAWVAATRRANHILEHFDQSPALEEALGILITAYEHLQLPDLARDAKRVLALNFPNSMYLREQHKG